MEFPTKILAVKWIDAKSEDAWQSREEALASCLIDYEVISVGSLLVEDKNHIVLLQSDSHDGNVAGWLSIPKRWVIEQKQYNLIEEKKENE